MIKKTLIAGAIMLGVFSVGANMSGCSWFNAGGGAQLEEAGVAVGSCALTQVLSGNVNPATILTACVGATLSQVVSIIESVVAYYAQPAPVESGMASSSGTMCGVGTPPMQGLPQCVDASSLAKMKAFLANAAATTDAAGQ